MKSTTVSIIRSLDGEGNFNWRFIFDFEYVPQEGRMVISSGTQLSAKHIILSTNPTPGNVTRRFLFAHKYQINNRNLPKIVKFDLC